MASAVFRRPVSLKHENPPEKFIRSSPQNGFLDYLETPKPQQQNAMTILSHMIGTLSIAIIAIPLSAQVDFSAGTFEEVIHQAQERNKKVFVDAYTDWCGWCKVMDQKTFSQPEVGRFVDSLFVATKINMEEGFGVKLAMKYRVTSYPQYLIFDAEGHLESRLSGFMEPDAFMESVNLALIPSNTLPPIAEPLEFDLPYPDFLRRAYAKGRDKNYPTAEDVDAYLDTRDDLTDEVSWAVISRFVSKGGYADTTVALREELASKYGQDEVTSKLASFVFTKVKKAIKDSSKKVFDSALDEADRTLGADAPYYKLRYQLYFDQMTGDWPGFAKTANSLIQDMPEKAPPSTQNAVAWALYEHSDDAKVLTMAADWMKKVIEAHPRHAYLDTYAALLYKLGDKKRALDIAERALTAADAEGVDAQPTRILIDKIKSP